MDLSIYLAKVLGLYLLIVCLAMILNKEKLKPIVLDLLKSPALLFLSGFMALIIGLLLVTSHNIWVMDWRVLITLLGWLSLAKGIIRITFPDFMLETSEKWIQSNSFYYTAFGVYTVVGVVLVYFGYA